MQDKIFVLASGRAENGFMLCGFLGTIGTGSLYWGTCAGLLILAALVPTLKGD